MNAHNVCLEFSKNTKSKWLQQLSPIQEISFL